MTWIQYVKDSVLRVIYFFVILGVVDLILMSSAPLSMAGQDILYVNLLVLVISTVFFAVGYIRCKAEYRDLRKALDNGQNIDRALPKSNSFLSQLIRDVAVNKDKELYEETEELKSLLNEVNDYITQWVHEIKIPISACELIAERLEEENLEDPGRISEETRKELARIKFLVEQVLYASRASSYSEDLFVEELNIQRVVKDVVKKNASFFISKNIDVSLENLDYNVMTDRKWISYILEQLLNNACKYVEVGGKIKISAESDEQTVKLRIRDNGIGIPVKDLSRVFDKGFTGDNGRRMTKSTGMGLYFSKKMADKLGHGMEVSSEVSNYTEFTITFYALNDYFKVTKM